MSRIAVSLLVILASVHSATALAQRGPMGSSPRTTGFGLPEVGSMLPDVSVFDDDGNAFSTKSLRGHYSVLVFGCLT